MYKRPALTAMIFVLIFLTICLVYANQIIRPAGVYVTQTRDTNGTLTFTVRTVTYGGGYAPRNVGAIWITNSSNQFVKTIKVWAQNYRSALVRWLSSSGNNTAGATTGATLTTHQLHTVSWNGTNVSNALVADGTYYVNVEFAEHNASSSNMGKYSVHTFIKGPAGIDQDIPNETYFQNMHLTWLPVVQNGTISGTVLNAQNTPVSGAVVSTGTQTGTTNASGVYTISVAPGIYNVICTAETYSPQTQNGISVVANQTTNLNFNMGSQLTGTISGNVNNAQNDPIEGATITAGTQTATSNSTGFYTLSVVIGTYNMNCSAINYSNHTQNNVTVTADQTTTVNFNMGNPDLGEINGIVTNTLNEPIQGATVSIGAISDETDVNGFYSISLLPGTFGVSCSAPDYQTQTLSNIVITSNQTTTLDFALNPITAIDDNITSPLVTLLQQNYPNPFSNSTAIRFYLDKNAQTELKIYDLKGKLVTTLLNGQKNSGWHEITWNGKDDLGRDYASGKYLYQLKSLNISITKMLILLN